MWADSESGAVRSLAGKEIKDALGYLCDSPDLVGSGICQFVSTYRRGTTNDQSHSGTETPVAGWLKGGGFMGVKLITLVGIALILLGIVAFIYQGISYTSREKVIDIGPLQASVDTKKTIPLPPILGGLVLAGGIVLVVVGAKKSS